MAMIISLHSLPLGPILGPLLFTMYINEVPAKISVGKSFIYADDTAVVLSNKDPVQLQFKLNAGMSDLHAWFTANMLSLNISKSNLIFWDSCTSPCYQIYCSRTQWTQTGWNRISEIYRFEV